MFRCFKFVCFLLFVPFLQLDAQISDNILWAKLGIQKKLQPKTTVFFAPILRLNDDISAYQDFSLDYAVRQKLNKHFSIQLTGRTWFLRDGRKRQFIWPQVSFANTFEYWKVSSFLRLHYAMDIDDVEDADFLRWKTSLTVLKFAKTQFFTGIEPWLRFNSFNELQRIRYSIGAKQIMSDQLSLSLDWWLQKSINLNPEQNVNIYVLAINYIL